MDCLQPKRTDEGGNPMLRPTGAGSSVPSGALDAFISGNSTSPAGYTFGGSLYRGSGYWATQAALPSPRSDFQAAAADDKAWIVGGHDGNGTYLTSVFVYDSILNAGNSSLADMPEPRTGFATAYLNGSIYVIGGFKSEANEQSGSPEKCTLVYDTVADKWSQRACLSEARAESCAAVVDGKIFALGGLGSKAAPLTSIETYDPASNAWTKVADLPILRLQSACASVGKTILIAGGYMPASGKNPAQDLANVTAFDTVSLKTTARQPMQYARYDLALVALPNDRVVALGGGNHLPSGTQVGLHFVEEYNFNEDVWVEKAPMDTQRFSFGAAYIDEGVYAFGGHTFCATPTADCANRTLDSVEVLYASEHPEVYVHTRDPAAKAVGAAPADVLLLADNLPVDGFNYTGSLYAGSGYWSSGPELPFPWSDQDVVADGDVAYIVGGRNVSANKPTDQLYKYKPVLRQFTQLATMPEPRTSASAAIVDGLLYVTGGYNNVDDPQVGPAATTLVYNISSDTWTTSKSQLNTPRSDHCMVALAGKIYLAGGYSTNYTQTLSTAEVYDPNTDSWSPITDMPTPRGDLLCEALNGEVVMVGGFYDPTGQFLVNSFRPEVEAYKPSRATWRQLAPVPNARGDFALVAMPGGRMLAMGGETHARGDRTQIATHQVDEYIAGQDLWVPKAPLSASRFRADGAYMEGAVVVFGGQTSAICPPQDGNGLSPCAVRGLTSTESYFDTEYPDVFLYVKEK
ncbi:hypothetical protein WJX72_009543 [[Myrmecia] bisecta]|uniref:Uncharacterized protein n=1 Tax=[Myrmecia] bisecta TaxID=41462 RepID=A0AAW1PQK9_9CHLO